MADELDDERAIELSSITAIFPELVHDPSDPFVASLDIPVEPTNPLVVTFPSSTDGAPPIYTLTPPGSEDGQEGLKKVFSQPKQDTHKLSYLPPLRLQIALPEGYPEEKPPQFHISTEPDWLPQGTKQVLEEEGQKLWEEYGRSQVVFGYIDYLQQAAEKAFDFAFAKCFPVTLSSHLKVELLDYDLMTKRAKFEAGTYECGVCLEPKKGAVCHQMIRCGHVFCISCLQDFYNNCITEGDVAGVKCMAPGCAKELEAKRIAAGRPKRKSPKERTLNPSELLQIPLEYSTVQRYVELKRKKKLESDKSTVYCPRKWCQGPARSKKYPKITDLTLAVDSDSDDDIETASVPTWKTGDDESKLPPPAERLAVCEKCAYAFCRICMGGWHGEYARCWPRSAAELSEEEKASYEYIMKHTSPCPTCSSPCQKTHGCNHMNCFQCHTHFCYLCGAWLDAQNPYVHFNQPGRNCYGRLWELEEGDDPEAAQRVAQGQQRDVRFDGARGWEQALLAAEEADEREQEEQRRGQQGQNRQQQGQAAPLVQAPQPPRAGEDPPLVVMLNRLQVQERQADRQPQQQQQAQQQQQQRQVQRQQPQQRQGQAGQAVAQGYANQPQAQGQGQVRGLQRFLEMVNNDEEDGWDSDELDEEGDMQWDIPER